MDPKNLMPFAPGQVIFREGEQGELMYILVEGAVELTKKTGKGETILKTVSQPYEFFGEMALVDGRPRSATARAKTIAKLAPIDQATFERMILTNGKFALKIIKVLSERIRRSNAQIGDLIETLPRERLVRGLVDYAVQGGERIYSGIKVNVDEVAAWMNTHLGISAAEAGLFIHRLVKEESISYAATSARSKEAVVLSEDFIRANNRRTG
jgi:CRP/FNR family transcriptional regulator, cyclic AMP receptor protein